MPQFNQQQFAPSLETYSRVVAMVTAPFTGIAVTLLLTVLWRLYRRAPLPLTRPGHWVLLILGVLFSLNAAAQFVPLVTQGERDSRFDLTLLLVLMMLVQGIMVVAAAWLCWTAWRRTASPPRWRFVFGSSFVLCIYWLVAVALGAATILLGDFAMVLMLPVAIIAIPIVIAWLISFPTAVIQDLWHRERYDPLHWAGMILVIVNVLAGISGMVVPLFVIRS